MPKPEDAVAALLDLDELGQQKADALGPISRVGSSYSPASQSLLGYVLQMAYEEATVVTCDAWKLRCGGVPKNSFVLIRLGANAATAVSPAVRNCLILARVLEAVPTPVSSEVQQTVFAIHKVQAALDPFTNAELQWGALKVGILGTYYDDRSTVAYGSDIDSYVSPHFYEVYVPKDADLAMLINSFVETGTSISIGELRYTESQITSRSTPIEVAVAPHDFVTNRTALFGKTRMGKSNTIKVIADMMLRSTERLGQIVFDLNGEYSNVNEQDNTSLFDLHKERCVRYSLNPSAASGSGAAAPKILKANFLIQVVLGHSIIRSLWDTVHDNRPGYLQPLLEWDPCDPADINTRFTEWGDRTRYGRAMSMYFAALCKAGFKVEKEFQVKLHLNAPLRERLAGDAGLAGAVRTEKTSAGKLEIAEDQPIRQAVLVYEKLYVLHKAGGGDHTLFPPGGSGAYFDDIHLTLLRMIGDAGVTGTRYLIPFAQYHDLQGRHIIAEIVADVDAAKTVIIDLANADEVVSQFYSGLISRAVFKRQTEKFTQNALGDHSVLFYFEEAHNLFNKDDKDLTSVYNRIAKEGAKNRIGMVYSTQSMTTLSPDLLKNTENFFIAHLNDDREISELTKKYEFRDVGVDVQRCRTRGYVRMITLSHRFALPVQIRKFGARSSPHLVSTQPAVS